MQLHVIASRLSRNSQQPQRIPIGVVSAASEATGVIAEQCQI